jgi:valyl-tRNA synthetase
MMPFITEAIWNDVKTVAGVEARFLVERPWVGQDEFAADAEAGTELEWVKGFITGLRRIRAEMDIAPGKPLPVLVENWMEMDQQRYLRHRALLDFLAKPESVTWLNPGEDAPESALSRVGDMRLLIPLAGLIDKDAEIARLEKEIGKLDRNLEQSRARLANESFVARAPAEVVEKERARVSEMNAARSDLGAQLERIQLL